MRFSLDPDREVPPRELGGILGLYDKPPYRDWLAWWTACWTIFAGLAIAFPTTESARTSSLPRWLDALLAALVFGLLFGVIPAYVRLLVRRRVIRQRRRKDAAAQVPGQPASSVEPLSQGPSHPAPARPPLPVRPPSAPSRPVSLATLDLSSIQRNSVLTEARSSLPYPVARSVRKLQLAGDAREMYDVALRTAETLATVLGITGAAWARHRGVTTEALDKLEVAYVTRGVSQGHWIDVARSMESPLAREEGPVPGMADALRRGKGGSGLLYDLDQLVAEWNRWAHGAGPRNKPEAAERLAETMPHLERALERASFLTEWPWVLIEKSQWRRRERDFLVSASRAMGDHPDFDHMSITTTETLADDIFYILSPTGAIDLTPLVVIRPCPTCHQREVAYADKLDKNKGVSLKTFDRGHVLYEPSLVDEIRTIAHPHGNASDAI